MRLAAACIAAPQMCIAKANARITFRINNQIRAKKATIESAQGTSAILRNRGATRPAHDCYPALRCGKRCLKFTRRASQTRLVHARSQAIGSAGLRALSVPLNTANNALEGLTRTQSKLASLACRKVTFKMGKLRLLRCQTHLKNQTLPSSLMVQADVLSAKGAPIK
jgi:hypothetical protein